MNILFNVYVIISLRVLHVACGILWAGAAALYLFLLVPNAKSDEEAGQKFMKNLGPRFGLMMRVVTTITVLSGGLLYARFLSGGMDWIWTTGPGLGFTIGALAAVISYVMGVAIFGPTQDKIAALDSLMSGAGGPPKPEQAAEMDRLQAYLMKNYRIDFVLLAVSVTAMAVARYL